MQTAKPLYLLFLKTVMAAAPQGSETRAIVIVQSLLLFLAIVWVSLRRGGRAGVATAALLLLCLRLRDSASAVMPEALTAALLLIVTDGLLSAPQTWRLAGALGAVVGALFWVRPNAGAIALALVVARYALSHRWTAGLKAAAAFLLVVVPIALATRPGEDGPKLRGLAYPLLVGSVDDSWAPAAPPVEAPDLATREREEIRRTRENWRAFGAAVRNGDPDARRQLAWRAFRGLFASEYSDATWSGLYLEADNLSRQLMPILLLAALSLFLTLPFGERPLNAVALLLVAAVVAQSLAFGPLPRYTMPYVPALLVFAVPASIEAWHSRRRTALAVGLFLVLAALGFRGPFVFEWEWGRVESAGLTLRQRIPRGALPEAEPATLHIRIGPVVVPSGAGLDVFGPGDRLLSSIEGDSARPDLSIPLPRWLLEENQKDSVELRLVSRGGYGPESFLLFPVIPPPWSRETRREASAALSPSTGISHGALDWWTHAGADARPQP